MSAEKILNDRQNEYGDADRNFSKIGALWAVILDLDQPIEAHVVALMMDQLKTVRILANPEHADSWYDKLGYTTLGVNIVNRTD